MATQSQQHKRQCKDNQSREDIFSDIPDCLLVHILSFLSTKDAVQTCILSKRWIHLWKTLPTLRLRPVWNDTSLRKFVDRFLSLRDHSSPIHAISTIGSFSMSPSLMQRIMKYAFSHGIQHLNINISYSSSKYLPSCLFSSHTLTYLALSGDRIRYARKMKFPNSLNLPALTTLSLTFFSFSRRNDDDGCVVDPFSTFNMLNTLILYCCKLLDNAQNLRISSTNLVNLTICTGDRFGIYRGTSFGIELCTPTLRTFAFRGNQYINKFYGSKSVFSSIRHASIYFSCQKLRDNPSTLLNWLVELANIESLTVSHHTLEVLSNLHDLSKVVLPSLYNLKSLIIKTRSPSCIPPIMVVDFLLQNSSLAKVDTISSPYY